MPAHPDPEEQVALLDALAALVAACGPEPLLRSPVEPTAEFFPDAWRPDMHGARALLQRVMSYAGMSGVPCVLAGDSAADLPLASLGATTHVEGAAAWFWGFAEGTAWFGVDQRMLADPEGIVAALCHEAAHAFRHKHGLVAEASKEELRTDVTTVYLGFGVLTTNAAYRSRTEGELQGTMAVLRWSHSTLGYLAPESFAFLLAAQMLARRATASERRRVRSHLEANQAAAFDSACRLLARDERGVLRRLGLPLDRRPLPAPLATVQGDAPRDLPPPDAGAPGTHRGPGWNAGMPVFRVPSGTRARGWQLGGFIVGVCAGLALRRFGVHGVLAPAAFGSAGLVVGRLLASRAPLYECSEPECGALVERGASTCPRCGGLISGDLRHANERLAAVEALQRRGGDGAVESDPP
jgi:hypothetical protein